MKVIISPTPQTEIKYDKEPNYSALPNEVPDLIAPFKELARFDERIQKLKNIIGVLPYPEQYALLQAYKEKTEGELFSTNTYNNFISDNGIFTKEIEAISDYVTEFEKKLAYGIGCIKSVTNKYFREGKDNVEYQDKIYSNINAILTAQGAVNQAQAQFIKELEEILFNRRQLLLGTPSLSNGTFIFDNQDNNDQGNVRSIKYSENDVTKINNAFVSFLSKQKDFTKELAKNSMDAIMTLSNMDGCRNYKDPNLNAGESSKGVEKPEIDYKKGRVQTGVNDEARIREDKATTNGFLIEGGFQKGFASKGNVIEYSVKDKPDDDTLKIINNCFGVFASGGQDDKDACRDVMVKRCGIDLDYQCKKSGFYDYVVANPFLIDGGLSNKLDKNDQKLLTFIDKYFIQNSIAIKPSGIIGFNTIVQKLEKELEELSKLSDPVPIVSGSVTSMGTYSGSALFKINIFEASPNSNGDPSLKQTLMDEFLYNYLDNHSSFIK